MNNFLNIIARKEADAMTVWSENARIINQDDKAALITELTDLRIRLQEAQETITKVETELKSNRVTAFFDWLMIGLYISTLIFGGISYIL
jgi:PHD/YefM family antitoxin component YafN of YafNO toxin-antitoxin module